MDEAREPERSIRRRDLPAVVQRAAELAAGADDADEALSEQEVVRIAAELGLPARHVQQALYEGVREEVEPSFLDRQLGTPRILATRAVPFDVQRAQRVLEDYLVTSEYLCVVRRQGSSVTFEPAPDAVSKIARKFKRSGQHHLAAAEIVDLSVRPLESGWSHIRLRAVYADDRRARITRTIIGSVVLGIPVAGAVGIITGGIMGGLVGSAFGGPIGQQVALVTGGLFGIAAFWGVVAGSLASMRRRYREWRERTTTQTEGVLDRLETGDDMRPPPPPWIKKLQMKFGQL